eukprot:TRINITY_DN6544_c0_g1_i1.p1 TRINITY_DN6544_c0_g1~~TRINITY_DN6544_c0_g1_i1.p1  ORF type:complete len:478 (+),score=110.22 TRINITY_DN6544_c0_g1_i1:248-1681(+)
MHTTSVLALAFAFIVAIHAVSIKVNHGSVNIVPVDGTLRAGVAKVDGTLPMGVPLAGFNWGPRRVPHWPVPEIRDFTTFMMPSTGVDTPTWVKALVIDTGSTQVAFATMDAIGADGNVCKLAYELAVEGGFTISFDNFVCSGSHTHSGPGAVSSCLLWSLAPATDVLVPSVQREFASKIASALLEAQAMMQPVKIGMGLGSLTGVTRNRRADISPYVTPTTIDPNLGVIRVDDLSGKPIATLWNYAIHGTCLGPSNMHFNSDIMGAASDEIEKLIGGVSLFVNSDAGDIAPTGDACHNNFQGGLTIAQAVQSTRASLVTSTTADLKVASTVVDFGPTQMNITLARFENCTQGGELDICTLCAAFHCDLNAHLPNTWVEDMPKFTALRWTINGETHLMVTIPGEALSELGKWIRNGTQALGYSSTFLLGYSNAHMGYFATPDEYLVGGYESQLTFWGINTAAQIRDGCLAATKLVTDA